MVLLSANNHVLLWLHLSSTVFLDDFPIYVFGVKKYG